MNQLLNAAFDNISDARNRERPDPGFVGGRGSCGARLADLADPAEELGKKWLQVANVDRIDVFSLEHTPKHTLLI
jgi:hypothetical protein